MLFRSDIAPSYQRIIGANILVSINPFIRQDRMDYYPSRDPFNDVPATISQKRRLTNYGFRAALSLVHNVHNLKVGTQITRTDLSERFRFGITEPLFNAICQDSDGNSLDLPAVTDPEACHSLGFEPNPGLAPGLIPFDLTRGGSLLRFQDTGAINQYAAYVQDAITLGQWKVNAGLRVDRYDGISRATGVQPRLGFSYLVKRTATVLRGSYSRTFETPYNENLLLSSSTGQGGLPGMGFGTTRVEPIKPGRRNQFNVGFQQVLDGVVRIDAGYFWKFTDNAFDFATLFDTPLTFPISWRKSKIDGAAIRISTPNLHGLTAYTTIGHTRARFFGPENGGLIFNSSLDDGVFRIDHDQAFQQATNFYYQRPDGGPWVSFTWHYNSGMVSGDISISDALSLTGDQQAAMGFFCGSQVATPDNPIRSCPSGGGATRVRIPAPGTANADLNPPRIVPRHLFDVGVGTDNLLHGDRTRLTLRFTVVNLTNTVALYNFLSTFSGTHFVTPRSYTAEMGIVF